MSSLTDDIILRMLRRKLCTDQVTILQWKMGAAESLSCLNSATFRFFVEYQFEGETVEEWFFAKMPALGKMFEYTLTVGVLDNELISYELILPHIRQIGCHVAPQLFFSSKLDYCLILEDLTAKGYENPAPRLQFDLEATLRILQELAQFHAASIHVHRLRGDVYEWLNTKYVTNHPLRKIPDTGEKVGKLFLKLVRRVDANFAAENAEPLDHFKETIWPSSFSQRMCDPDAFNVFSHGDFWTSNILLKYDGPHIEDVRFVDFQFVAWNSPAVDVLPFLMTSVKFDVFEQNEDRIYGTYVNTLNEALQKLGIDRLYTVEELVQDIESRYSFWLYFVIVRMAAAFCNPDEFEEELLLEGRFLNGEWYRSVADKWMSYFIRKSIKFPKRGLLSEWYRKDV